jgi:hypothetical protein|tara:strand:- start:5502 stop:6398 length:897 start_codon:yes stop_codon:yes gene_type:complete
MKTPKFYSYGHELDNVGALRESQVSGGFGVLRKHLKEDGYLFIRDYLDREQVLSVREEISEEMSKRELLDSNYSNAELRCQKDETVKFIPEVANNSDKVKELLYSGRLPKFYESLYGESVKHYDYTWLRAMPPGKGTNPHTDLPYMGRGTHNHMTCWVPYGDISYDLGGLAILEKSQQRMDLLEKYVFRDVDSYCENNSREKSNADQGKWTFTGTLSKNPKQLAEKFESRWLTAQFRAGDFLTFSMFTVHAAMDNLSNNEYRLSSDSRYQRASEPIDERWIGENPPGHTVAGKRGRIC